MRVAGLHVEGGALNQGEAWLARGDQLAEGTPDSAVHGWLAVLRALIAMLRGDVAMARELGERARDIGRRIGDPGVEAMGLNAVGRASILDGQLKEGC